MSDYTGEHIPTTAEVAQLSAETRADMAAAYLSGLEPGRQPLGLFTQLSRLSVMSIVELVPVRAQPKAKTAEILLLRRPQDDPWWPGQWHVPGTVILPSDEVIFNGDIDFDNPNFDPIDSYTSPVSRLVQRELQDKVEIMHGPYLLESRFRLGERGYESAVMLWAEVNHSDDQTLEDGQFFVPADITDRSPVGGLVAGHQRLAHRAAEAFDQ